MEDIERRAMVREALDLMPAEHRLILLLNQQQGHTILEIAKMLNRSPGRTGGLLAEAKHKFRALIRGEKTTRTKRLPNGSAWNLFSLLTTVPWARL